MNCPKCKSKNTEYGDRIIVSDGKEGTKILYHKCLDCGFRYDHDGKGGIIWKMIKDYMVNTQNKK